MKKEDRAELKLLFQAILVGLLTGVAVGLFRFGIYRTSAFWLSLFSRAHQNIAWLLVIIIGFAAIGVLAGYFVKQYPHVGGSGIPEVKLQLSGRLQLHWWPILWRKLIGGILVIGTGLFLGPEGPSLQLGSSVGQGLGEKVKQSKTNQRVLIATGAASGLSAAFGAPLSGTMFVLEEVFHNFSPRVWLNALAGAIAADFLISNFFGIEVPLGIAYNHPFPIALYWHLLILGLILGLLGHLYKWGLFKGKKLYEKIPGLPRWLQGLIPLALLLPIAYYLPNITGPGDDLILSLKGMLSPNTVLLCWTLIAYYVIRLVFSIISYDSGLPSGIFLPILTMGALIGAGYGAIMVHLGLLPAKLVVNLIIFAMAGYFAAIIRAPFTAILLITEMVGSLLHLMPLAVVAFVALLVDQMLGGRPIYGQLAEMISTKEAPGKIDGTEDQLTISIYESSRLVDKTIAEVKWPQNTLVKVIHRDGTDIIPDGQTRIFGGDQLVLAVDSNHRGEVFDQLKQLQKVNIEG